MGLTEQHAHEGKLGRIIRKQDRNGGAKKKERVNVAEENQTKKQEGGQE